MTQNIKRADAKLIAEAASDCADKALYWKERYLAAEEALSKFAGEIYGAQRNCPMCGGSGGVTEYADGSISSTEPCPRCQP